MTTAAFLSARTVIEVTGEDRKPFLQNLITNDVEKLSAGEARFAALLTPQGKVLFDFFVVGGEDAFYLDCARDGGALLKRLAFYKLRSRVALSDVGDRFRVAAAWGDGIHDMGPAIARYRDPRHAALGYRAMIEEESPAFAASASEGAYETLRIGLAVPEGGKDFGSGEIFPHDACFDLLHGIDFRKGCYVGQEVVSRMQHRGLARTRVFAVSAETRLPEARLELLANGFPVGRLGSVSGERAIALARLDRVAEAISKGQPILAGDVPVRLEVPEWAPYAIGAQTEHTA